jgi:hypothetical protein
MRPFRSAVRLLLAALRRPVTSPRGPGGPVPGATPPRPGPALERDDYLLAVLRALSAWGT